MGQARQRGTFEQRMAQAIKNGEVAKLKAKCIKRKNTKSGIGSIIAASLAMFGDYGAVERKFKGKL